MARESIRQQPVRSEQTVHRSAEFKPPVRETHSAAGDEQIRVLAYELWQRRGCPVGSPEEDWLQAERQLSPRKNVA